MAILLRNLHVRRREGGTRLAMRGRGREKVVAGGRIELPTGRL